MTFQSKQHHEGTLPNPQKQNEEKRKTTGAKRKKVGGYELRLASENLVPPTPIGSQGRRRSVRLLAIRSLFLRWRGVEMWRLGDGSMRAVGWGFGYLDVPGAMAPGSDGGRDGGSSE